MRQLFGHDVEAYTLSRHGDAALEDFVGLNIRQQNVKGCEGSLYTLHLP
jgi:hypothetical protein